MTGVLCTVYGAQVYFSGLYCSGWASRGPVGVILTTMTDGFETGKLVLKDLADGVLQVQGKSGKEAILQALESTGIFCNANIDLIFY